MGCQPQLYDVQDGSNCQQDKTSDLDTEEILGHTIEPALHQTAFFLQVHKSQTMHLVYTLIVNVDSLHLKIPNIS